MDKNIKLTEANYNADIVFEFDGTGNDKLIISQVSFDTIVGIVNTIYNAMLSIPDDMYAIKRPLLVFHILNELSNLDVSDVFDVKETEDNNKEYTINLNRAFALSVSNYGKLVNHLLNGNEGYNCVYVIGQLLDKKLEMFERTVMNTSPSDDILNEMFLLFNNINTTLNTITEKVAAIDSDKLNKQLVKFTPKTIVDTYLNSKFAKNKINEVVDAKNNEINKLKQKLNNYTAKNVMADNIVHRPKKDENN